MDIIKIGFRNLIRNRHRTVVTTFAMGFAGFIMILFASLMQGMLQASERNAVSMDVGDIQIHVAGFRDDPDLYKQIKAPDVLIKKIETAGLRAAPRLYGFGLAASGSASSGVQLHGLNVPLEREVTEIHKHLAKGAWLDPNDPGGVVIGRRLAKTLDISVGSELIFLGQSADGGIANAVYRVRGVLKSVGDSIDRSGLFMVETAFRGLMVLPEGAHEIAVMRPDRRGELSTAKSQIASLAGDYETLDWKEIRPTIARLLEMADTQLIIIMIIITYIAVATVVLNAMLMGVFERIREFGIMKAIGVKPWQIIGLIYVETLAQTAAASVLALGTGWAASVYLQKNGIDLTHIVSGASVGGVAIDPIWRAQVSAETVMTPILFLFIMAVIAVIYPAMKAAFIRPVDAIHDQ